MSRSKSVAVYNLGHQEFLHYTSLQKALRNILNGKYRIVSEDSSRTWNGMATPIEVELVRWRYAKEKYDSKGEVPFSRRGVLRRDNYTCAYCGKYGDTVDHIMPKWQGNSASWMNSITACFPCNNKKGGRSPREAGMKLLFSPRVPTFAEAFNWTKAGRTADDKRR